VLLTLFAATGLALSTIDPVKVTEYSIVLSAAALPLTYFPILVVANDRQFMGSHVNSKFTNGIALIYLLIILVVSVATIPLMLATKAGM
jgi:Mn2+/Fe2+ NRAMP family transporter